MFFVLPAILISSTYTDKNSPFARLTNKHYPVFRKNFLKISFPTIVLPEGDRTNSFREERLDLPYWTMIFAICALVDVSKYLGILTFEFSIACDLWAPRGLLHGYAAHPRAITFPPRSRLFVESISSGLSASRNTFSVSAPFLPLRWPDCTLSRLRAEEYDRPVTQRPCSHLRGRSPP